MTSPVLPTDAGVLSVYLGENEPRDTRVIALEDLRKYVRQGLPVPPAPRAPGNVGAPPPPPPGARGPVAVVPVPVAPPPEQEVTLDQLNAVLAGARALASTVDGGRAGYRIGDSDTIIRPLALEWCKADAPAADLLKALNLSLRLRKPDSTVRLPKLVAPPQLFS